MKKPCRTWVRKYNFHGNKMLLTCYIKDPPFQVMLCVWIHLLSPRTLCMWMHKHVVCIHKWVCTYIYDLRAVTAHLGIAQQLKLLPGGVESKKLSGSKAEVCSWNTCLGWMCKKLFWLLPWKPTLTTFITASPPAGKRVEVSKRLYEHVALCLNRVLSISVTIGWRVEVGNSQQLL